MVKRERSKAYPSYNLEDCIENAQKIREALGKGKHNRESIAQAMGFSPGNADVLRRISSMVQFGLLEKHTKENAYSLVIERIDKIMHPKHSSEVTETLKELFYMPTLYRDIMANYESDRQIPKQLSNILYRDHGITQSASADATKVFTESGIFADILDENNRIIDEKSNNEDTNPPEHTDSSFNIDNQSQNMVQLNHPTSNQDATNSIVTVSQNQTFNFALTEGKFAQLIVPVSLTPKDIAIIRKQIELLDLQIDEN